MVSVALRLRLLALCLFGLYAVPVHFWPDMHTANEAIRLYFVQAAVDHHELSVDRVLARYRMENLDRSVKDGKSYLDKAPGLSLLAIPPYWVLTRLGFSTELARMPYLSHFLLLLVVAIPCVLGAGATFSSALELGGDARAARRAALLLGIASPYAIYATLFFGHAACAACLAGAFWVAQRVRHGLCDERWLLASGALAGLMVLIETPAALLGLGLSIYVALAHRSPRALALFGVGAAPFLAIQITYNWALFGGPFAFAYGYKSDRMQAASHARGLFGIALPRLENVARLLVGSTRGLFFGWPVLLLSVPGLVAMRKRRDLRPEWWTITLLPIGYVLAISSFADWRAGAAYGPRHLVPVVPLLVLPLAFVRDRVSTMLLPGLAGFSFFSAFAPIVTFPYAMEQFDNPVFEQALPLLADGYLGPSLLSWLGAPAATLAAWVVLLGALVAFLHAHEKEGAGPSFRPDAMARALLTATACFVAAAACTPAPTPAKLASRANVLSMFGARGAAEARAICEQANACERHLLRFLEKP